MKLNLALLRSAYLEMFYYFGHSFLFNESSKKMREQINNPTSVIFPNHFIVETDFDDNLIGVNIIKDVNNKVCFLVVFDLKVKQNSYKKRIGVLIPGPDDIGWGAFCNFDIKSGVKILPLGKLNLIKEKCYALAFYKVWEDVKYLN